MSEVLHIEREPPITIDEWKAALRRVEGVRMTQHGPAGDAEVFMPKFAEWAPAFVWHNGSIAFKDGDELVGRLALQLARALKAQVVER